MVAFETPLQGKLLVSGALRRVGAGQQTLGLASHLASWLTLASNSPSRTAAKQPGGTYRIVWLPKRCPQTPGYYYGVCAACARPLPSTVSVVILPNPPCFSFAQEEEEEKWAALARNLQPTAQGQRSDYGYQRLYHTQVSWPADVKLK